MKKTILLFGLFILFQLASVGQSKDFIKCDSCEYMTIISEFANGKFIRATITEPKGKVEEIEKDLFKKNYKYLETSIIIDLLEKYSKEEWMVLSSNMTVEGGSLTFYYLLSRKK